MNAGCRKLRSSWQMSWRRFVGTIARRYGQRHLTEQESLLSLSGGMLRVFST